MPLLHVNDLHVQFASDSGLIRAVNGMSFTLERGETLGIVGESGSGKSVTALSILGLLPQPPAVISSGQIHFDGVDLLANRGKLQRRLRGHRVAMIFQDPMTSLNPFLRISRQLTEVLEVHRGLSRKAALRQVIDMLERVGIPDAPKRVHGYPHEFSGGMRQRVMIAMSLLCEPELLIADEPTTALDVTIQAQIMELLETLKRERDMAIILITHDLGVVAGATDHVAVMYGGRRMEYASTSALFRTPTHPYTQGLLRAVPRLDVESGQTALYSIPGLPPVLGSEARGCPFAPRCDKVQEGCRAESPRAVTVGAGHEVFCHAVPTSEVS